LSILKVVPCKYQHWLLRNNEIVYRNKVSRGINIRVGIFLTIYVTNVNYITHRRELYLYRNGFLFQSSPIFNKNKNAMIYIHFFFVYDKNLLRLL